MLTLVLALLLSATPAGVQSPPALPDPSSLPAIVAQTTPSEHMGGPLIRPTPEPSPIGNPHALKSAPISLSVTTIYQLNTGSDVQPKHL